jgi:hypothetical protein
MIMLMRNLGRDFVVRDKAAICRRFCNPAVPTL